jgi:hypothetical protein
MPDFLTKTSKRRVPVLAGGIDSTYYHPKTCFQSFNTAAGVELCNTLGMSGY